MNSKFTKKEILGIIPARGGSKSIPRKNLLKILNKPLIAWTIEAAKAAKKINRVIVSTDDHEIAEVSREFGADVPFLRPKEYAEDFSRDIEYHLHTLNWLRDNESYNPFALVNLRPTTPLRSADIIDKAIEKFLANPDIDSLRSVQLAEQTPYKMWCLDENKNLKQVAFVNGVDEPFNEPRQKLPLIYWQNGYIDIVKSNIVIHKKSTSGDKIIPYFIEDPSIDLDYPEDVKKAEMQLKKNLINNKNNNLYKSFTSSDRYPS